MVRPLKVTDPDGTQRIIWREIMRNKDSRYDHRLHGVLAVARGLSCYKTAAIWGQSPRAVEYWVKRFKTEGVKGLQEKKRPGRPTTLTSEQMEFLQSDLERGPEAVGVDARKWTGILLAKHLREYYGVEMGVRQCQRLLKQKKGVANPA
jgi:transposase